MHSECGGDALVEGGNDGQEDEAISMDRCYSVSFSSDFPFCQEYIAEFDHVGYFGRKESPTVASLREGSVVSDFTEQWTSEQTVR
jgi:hypothetical protein